jgi:uncharacterized protein (DUF433 family)
MHNPPHPGEVSVDTTLLEMSLTALAQKLRMSPPALLPIIADWPKGRDRGDFTKNCSEKGMTTFEKVAESNRIEGIEREPTAEELELVERAQAQAQPTVVTDPEVLSGMPFFAGSRVPIDVVLASVDAGTDMPRIRQAYPFVTDEHITAARAYKASHPTPEFWQEASAIAVEYEGVGNLIRMWADAKDDAERLSIKIDIEELMADIKRAYP